MLIIMVSLFKGMKHASLLSLKLPPPLVQTGCYVDMGYLVLHGVDNNDPLDESGEDSRWLRLSHSEVAVLCVQCTGEARVRISLPLSLPL